MVMLNEYLTRNMDNYNQIDEIYTDYTKAFDKIDLRILLRNMASLGIRGNLFNG